MQHYTQDPDPVDEGAHHEADELARIDRYLSQQPPADPPAHARPDPGAGSETPESLSRAGGHP